MWRYLVDFTILPLSLAFRDNIRFDLLRSGSVELTTNKILERGFLEPVSRTFSPFRMACSLYWIAPSSLL